MNAWRITIIFLFSVSPQLSRHSVNGTWGSRRPNTHFHCKCIMFTGVVLGTASTRRELTPFMEDVSDIFNMVRMRKMMVNIEHFRIFYFLSYLLYECFMCVPRREEHWPSSALIILLINFFKNNLIVNWAK